MKQETPLTAAGYSPRQTLACEQALVNLLRGFGTLKESFRLVGGLVPRYLTPECKDPYVPPHAGTQDIDVVLDLQVLAKHGAYDSLRDQLKKLAFTRGTGEDGKPVSWRWQRQVGEHDYVVVEFLQDPLDEDPVAKRVASVPDEGISACKIEHCGIVHKWYREIEITAKLFDGSGHTKETVRYADLVAFILLKAVAIEQRDKPKDVGDLIHVLRYAGAIEDTAKEFAERWASGEHTIVFEKASQALRKRFIPDEGYDIHDWDGPVKYGIFMHGTDTAPDMEELRARARLDAHGTVERFLSVINEIRSPAAT